MTIKKLDPRGIAHTLALGVIVVGVAVVGTYMLVASHADSCSAASSPSSGPTSGPFITPSSGPIPYTNCSAASAPASGPVSTSPYTWTANGRPWASCASPGTANRDGYDGCFGVGTSMYAYRNIGVLYNLSGVKSGTATITVKYRQLASNKVPTGFTHYNVNLVAGGGSTWAYIATLQLPAGGPGVAQTYSSNVSVSINNPAQLGVQWTNDTGNASGDANLQIDSITLDRK